MNSVNYMGNPVNLKAEWIKAAGKPDDVCPLFIKSFSVEGEVKSATLKITALGVYEAFINENRVGEFFMAPGWTAYQKRLQVQTYDVTKLSVYTRDINKHIGNKYGSGYRNLGLWRSRIL